MIQNEKNKYSLSAFKDFFKKIGTIRSLHNIVGVQEEKYRGVGRNYPPIILF